MSDETRAILRELKGKLELAMNAQAGKQDEYARDHDGKRSAYIVGEFHGLKAAWELVLYRLMFEE